MKKLLLAFLLLHSAFSQGQKRTDPSRFAKTITAENLKKHLYIVASREMEGRETASEGQRKAAAYIESQFKSVGLLTPGNGDYQLQYPLYQDSLASATIEINGNSFELNKDFSTNVLQNNTSTYRFSEIVFVRDGIVDATRDDYRELDVRGKAVLMLAPEGRNWYGDAMDIAQKKGAAVILTISGIPFPRKKNTSTKGFMDLTSFSKSVSPNQFFISEKMAELIMGADYKTAKAGTLSSKSFKSNLLLSYTKSVLNLQSSNVIGVLEGTDLKDEYVFITAHYDHIGKQDSLIYYGADDDGSGTVSVIEIANAFTKAKAAGHGPRRSIVFMTVSGEEEGLFGSEYYTSHPLYPLEKTTVDLNIDMIGRIDDTRKQGDSNNYVFVVGDDKISSDLKMISEATNKKYTKLELDYKFNDPKDPERIYFRSDHFNFAKKGVPIIFYFDGMLGADLHSTTDTPDKIHYDLMAKRARLVFYTAWEIANRSDMLKRDIPLTMPAGF